MKYFVTVDGDEHEIELVERLGELRVLLDGESVDARYDEVDRLGQVALYVGTKSYAISIEGDANACTVTVAGRLYQVELEDERERAAHAAEREAGVGGGLVASVMPGVVVSLLVAPGDAIEAGQPLLILEAMKMQNEIDAPIAGVVRELYVHEGEAVAGGAKLVAIEPASDG